MQAIPYSTAGFPHLKDQGIHTIVNILDPCYDWNSTARGIFVMVMRDNVSKEPGESKDALSSNREWKVYVTVEPSERGGEATLCWTIAKIKEFDGTVSELDGGWPFVQGQLFKYTTQSMVECMERAKEDGYNFSAEHEVLGWETNLSLCDLAALRRACETEGHVCGFMDDDERY